MILEPINLEIQILHLNYTEVCAIYTSYTNTKRYINILSLILILLFRRLFRLDLLLLQLVLVELGVHNVVVVDHICKILVLFQVLLHRFVGHVDVWVGLAKPLQHIRIHNVLPWQLIPDCNPPRTSIVRPSKELQLAPTREESLDQRVNLIRLSTGLPHFRDKRIAVHVLVTFRVPLDSDQAVLLGMVEPVPGAAGPDDALELVCLDPDQLLHELVAPDVEALHPQLERATGDPQKNDAIVRNSAQRELTHLEVLEGPVGKGHMNIPRRISHDDVNMPEHTKIEGPNIAVNPLRGDNALDNVLRKRLGHLRIDRALLLEVEHLELVMDELAEVHMTARVQVGAIT